MCSKWNRRWNMYVFNMITGINESRTLARHISCKCGCKFDGRKWKLNQKWNNNKCWCECKSLKEHCLCKKGYFWIPATSSWRNVKYAGSIIGNSVVLCDEIIEKTKILQQKHFQQKVL